MAASIVDAGPSSSSAAPSLAVRDTNLGIEGYYPSLEQAKRRAGAFKVWGVLGYFPAHREAGKWLVVKISDPNEFPPAIFSGQRLPDSFRKELHHLADRRIKARGASEVYYFSRLPVGLSFDQAEANCKRVSQFFMGKRKKGVPKAVVYDLTLTQFPDEIQWPYFHYEANSSKNGDIFSDSDYVEGYKLALTAAGLAHVPLQEKTAEAAADENNNGDNQRATVQVKYGTSSETVKHVKPRKNVLENVQTGVPPMVSLQQFQSLSCRS